MRPRPRPLDRRRLLAAAATTAFGGTAGCVGGGEFGTGERNATDDPGGADEADGDGDGTDPGSELDLREANVTAVAVDPVDGDGDGNGDGDEDEEGAGTGDAYRLDVTLYHDDDGEDGYANWWQVEAVPRGDRLGRRELLHAHGTREFTRSATLAVPADADCVVVRGHDETHGYGGRAALVSLPDGASVGRRQGSEADSFGTAGCP